MHLASAQVKVAATQTTTMTSRFFMSDSESESDSSEEEIVPEPPGISSSVFVVRHLLCFESSVITLHTLRLECGNNDYFLSFIIYSIYLSWDMLWWSHGSVIYSGICQSGYRYSSITEDFRVRCVCFGYSIHHSLFNWLTDVLSRVNSVNNFQSIFKEKGRETIVCACLITLF